MRTIEEIKADIVRAEQGKNQWERKIGYKQHGRCTVDFLPHVRQKVR